MAKYLLHLQPDGKPVGVYSATEEYYDPSFKNPERHIRGVRDAPHVLRSWADWAERLASGSVPSKRLMRWDLIDHRTATLKRILEDAQDTWRPYDGP